MIAVVRLFVLLALFLPAVSTAADDTITPQERYDLGLKYMKRGYFTKALEQFNRVRNYHRDDPVSVLAELAIADLYFKKGDYEQARLAYEDFARLHPRNDELDYVVYRTGLSIYRRAPKLAGRDQVPTQQAVNTWAGFSARYPDSEHGEEVERLLDKCRERLAAKELFVAKFYKRRDAWGAVRMRTATLVKQYPDSELVPEALALQGRAYHEWGFTHDAEQIRVQLAADFPDSAELDRLDRALARAPGEPPEETVFVRPYKVSAGYGGPGSY